MNVLAWTFKGFPTRCLADESLSRLLSEAISPRLGLSDVRQLLWQQRLNVCPCSVTNRSPINSGMKILGHNFIVSGGSSGLGAATARRLISAGARVLLVDLNRDAGQSLAEELGANASFVVADVADATSAEGAFREAWSARSGN